MFQVENRVVLDEGHDIFRKITQGVREEVGWEGSIQAPTRRVGPNLAGKALGLGVGLECAGK